LLCVHVSTRRKDSGRATVTGMTTPTDPAAAPRVRLAVALISILTFAMSVLGGAALIALAIDQRAGALAYLSALTLVVIIGTVVCSVMSVALGSSPAPAEPRYRGNVLVDTPPAEPYDGPVSSLMSPYEESARPTGQDR
jgi:hypothetical protein